MLSSDRESSWVTGKVLVQSHTPGQDCSMWQKFTVILHLGGFLKLACPLINREVVVLFSHLVFIMPTKTKVITKIMMEKMKKFDYLKVL